MKIVLATPIYPPEIGGPSQYVKNLSERFEKKGIQAEVVSYNSIKKVPQPLRFIAYFLALLKSVKKAEIIYAFNLISCGLPAYCISTIFQKKFVVRLGGDFLWERKTESDNIGQSLKEYYQQPKSFKEKFFIFIINNILKKSDMIVFSSNFQKDIYLKEFQISQDRTVVISNPFPEIEMLAFKSENNRQFLYAGRLLKLKNLDRLINVFKKVPGRTSQSLTLKIIGDGPEEQNLKRKVADLGLESEVMIEKSIPHNRLLEEIAKSYICVLPSLTDISPNFVLECIKLKTPVLLTKETEYYNKFKDILIFFNPKDEKNMEEKITYLLNDVHYQNYSDKIKSIPTSYSWDDVAEKHILLFQKIQ